MPNIYDFTDYRSFLKAWMAEKPRQRTQEAFARRVGVSKAFVNMVLKGKRGVAPDDAVVWGAAMQLVDDELAYWVALVREAEGNEAEKVEAELELAARRESGRSIDAPIDVEAFGRVHTWTVLALAHCEDFRPDAEWLAKRIEPPIDPAEIRESLQALLTAGLLRINVAGRWVASSTPLRMPAETDRARVERLKRLHGEQIEHVRSVLEYPPEDRHVVSIVFPVARSALPDLVARLEQAVREAVEAAKRTGGPDHVVQVSLQVVPRARTEVG